MIKNKQTKTNDVFIFISGKLCTELYHEQSLSRRALILSKVVDKRYKSVLKESALDNRLFGQDLSEKVKSYLAYDKTSSKLFSEPENPTASSFKKSGNSRSLPNKFKDRSQQAFGTTGPQPFFKFKTQFNPKYNPGPRQQQPRNQQSRQQQPRQQDRNNNNKQ